LSYPCAITAGQWIRIGEFEISYLLSGNGIYLAINIKGHFNISPPQG